MALNFSEWLDASSEPQYTVEGKKPKCAEGMKWDKTLQTCVPIAKSTEGDKECPNAVGGYETIGATGLDGDGYAIAVKDVTEMTHTPLSHRERDIEDARQRNAKEQDDRMRRGKPGKRREDADDELLPGEVKKFNKVTGKWESNKR